MSAQGRKSLEALLQLSPESVTIRSKVISELRIHESKLNSRIRKDPKKAKDLSRKAWEAGEALSFLEERKSKLNVETSFKKHMADDDFVDIVKQGTLIKSVYITDDIELRNRILETSIHYDRTNQVSMNLTEFNQFIESLLAAVSRDSKMSEVESLLRLDHVDASERHKYPYALLSVCNSSTKEHLGFWFSSSAPHRFL
jgi:hypothetical protein